MHMFDTVSIGDGARSDYRVAPGLQPDPLVMGLSVTCYSTGRSVKVTQVARGCYHQNKGGELSYHAWFFVCKAGSWGLQ